jgi:mannitol-1-/sugar-/sorbitol-6-phosphatase
MSEVQAGERTSRSADRELAARGLLFDMDGVLVSSARSAERAWAVWAAEYGVDAHALLKVMHGRRSEDTIAEFLPADRIPAALARIEQIEIGDAGGVPEIPGAGALLRSLPRSVWAVVTSASNELARVRLSAAGLPDPPALITADDVARGKPAPDPYLAGARALRVDPADVIVFEDAAPGVASGHAAGARVVGVGPHALSADVVVPDLTRLTYADGVLTVW